MATDDRIRQHNRRPLLLYATITVIPKTTAALRPKNFRSALRPNSLGTLKGMAWQEARDRKRQRLIECLEMRSKAVAAVREAAELEKDAIVAKELADRLRVRANKARARASRLNLRLEHLESRKEEEELFQSPCNMEDRCRWPIRSSTIGYRTHGE